MGWHWFVTQGWIRPHGCIQLPANCWELAEPHRGPQPHGPAMSSQAPVAALPNFRSQIPGSLYLGLLFQKRRKNLLYNTIAVFWCWTLHCDRAADCLIAHLVQSVTPLSPILWDQLGLCHHYLGMKKILLPSKSTHWHYQCSKSFQIPPIVHNSRICYCYACTSRKGLPLIWMHQDLLLYHLCKHLACLWRRPVLPRPILMFSFQPSPEELHSFGCSCSAKRHELCGCWEVWRAVKGGAPTHPCGCALHPSPHGFPHLWSFILVGTLIQWGLWCAFLDWCAGLCPAWHWGCGRWAGRWRRKCPCVQNAGQGCNWWSQRANTADRAGIFTQGCFQIKVPCSKVSLMGSRLITLQHL